MNPVALITGAGGGIGAAVCYCLTPHYTIAAAGRDRASLEQVLAGVHNEGGAGGAVTFDLTDADATRAGLDQVREEFGPVSLLVANAGMAVSAPLGAEGAEELLRRHLELNLLGTARLIEGLLPQWEEAGGGRVVVIASSAALRGYAYVSAYAASKHALLGYARSAALELRRKRVAVNVICPHYVDSPLTDQSVARIVEATGKSVEEARAFLAAENPGGRLVTPDEVASATLHLAKTPRTGVVLELTGGETLTRDPGQPLD